jgi:zinc protease
VDGELIGRGTTVRRGEIDGVTVFWSDTAPRRMADLSFRSGRADEAFTLAGISHLIEHLAMYGIGRVPYQANAYVDHVRTAFHASASDDELVGHFRALTGRLASLPLARLPDEARILRTESVNHSPNLPLQFLWHRYGARGLGMLAIPVPADANPRLTNLRPRSDQG